MFGESSYRSRKLVLESPVLIYPGLKEEGSVLGGATQRVTSSEIGYAGSPPRDLLTRGRSIDSVDRPFQPSDWVDVNLEVPSTPRPSSALTNLTNDTSLFPATTPTSSSLNLKDVTPVPPPRRRKRNRGRPLPPKPDEEASLENTNGDLQHVDGTEEPFYSSVKSPKSSEDIIEEARISNKDVYEHKVNGTGKVIPSDVVSGKRGNSEKKTCRRRSCDDEDHDRFQNSPKRRDRKHSKDEEETKDIVDLAKTKNNSTVSLPNYDELDFAKHHPAESRSERAKNARNSTGNLPQDSSSLSPLLKKTNASLEKESAEDGYKDKDKEDEEVPRHGSSDNLSSTYQVLGKLACGDENGVDGFLKYDPSKLEDWDLSDISNCELNHRQHSFEGSPVPPDLPDDDSVEKQSRKSDSLTEHDSIEKDILRINGKTTPDLPLSLQKPVTFGKTKSTKDVDEWIISQERSLKYFDPPTMADVCNVSPICELKSMPSRGEPFFLVDPTNRHSSTDTIDGEPCRNESISISLSKDISRSIFGCNDETESPEDQLESKDLPIDSVVSGSLIRTISEESLPREMLDEDDDDFFSDKRAKDVHNKATKDSNGSVINVKTPPPSPEPRIKAEILDNDHSNLLKILKEEAEGSNLSSMTPSLTELEAALSDMLEKEEQHVDNCKKDGDTKTALDIPDKPLETSIEPKIVPVEKQFANSKQSFREEEPRESKINASNGDLVGDEKSRNEQNLRAPIEAASSPIINRKVSFCPWEESVMADVDLTDLRDSESSEKREDVERTEQEARDKSLIIEKQMEKLDILSNSQTSVKCVQDEPPEKPSRLPKINLDASTDSEESVPTPPKRRNRSSLGVVKEDHETNQNGTAPPDPYPNDRLI
ncbi:E3 ubiquitin-protein ligase RBBP6-like isoform X2 [Prorops nasuta]|uniref:E3 ubiquitin-protein ligase RBBP6-like isoform X2 n=1 Tax=Prorops nasuta TaxID=863751 RepID=UPI0034CDD9AB